MFLSDAFVFIVLEGLIDSPVVFKILNLILSVETESCIIGQRISFILRTHGLIETNERLDVR